jgi:hypothetical protein
MSFYILPFVGLLFEMRSHYIAQAGLELLSSSDLPASTSHVAETTDAHQHTQYILLFKEVPSGPSAWSDATFFVKAF